MGVLASCGVWGVELDARVRSRIRRIGVSLRVEVMGKFILEMCGR